MEGLWVGGISMVPPTWAGRPHFCGYWFCPCVPKHPKIAGPGLGAACHMGVVSLGCKPGAQVVAVFTALLSLAGPPGTIQNLPVQGPCRRRKESWTTEHMHSRSQELVASVVALGREQRRQNARWNQE